MVETDGINEAKRSSDDVVDCCVVFFDGVFSIGLTRQKEKLNIQALAVRYNHNKCFGEKFDGRIR